MLILRSCFVDRAASAAAAFAHIERDLISKLHRLEIRGFVEYLATISSVAFVSYMRALACPIWPTAPGLVLCEPLPVLTEGRTFLLEAMPPPGRCPLLLVAISSLLFC